MRANTFLSNISIGYPEEDGRRIGTAVIVRNVRRGGSHSSNENKLDEMRHRD